MHNQISKKSKDADASMVIEEIQHLTKKLTLSYFDGASFKMNDFMISQYSSSLRMYQEFVNKLIEDPVKVVNAQFSFWQEYADLYQKNMQYWLGMSSEIIVNVNDRDKQFRNEIWNEHPVYVFLKEFYQLVSKHTFAIINDSDEKSAKKVRFYLNQVFDAFSPNNFFMTNPEVLRSIYKTGGKSLLDGVKNLLNDLHRGNGQLAMTMTDLNAFEVGKNLAITPGKVIYQNDLMQLIQYTPTTRNVYSVPLLIIPPWINKYYILDLSQKNSLVKWLVDSGYTVFMISWVNPNEQHAHKDFQHYMLEGPIEALNIIEKITGQSQINTLGFCIGGTLLACTLAYLAQHNDNRIASATYLTTLLDFADPGDIGIFIDEPQLRTLEQHTNLYGYLNGHTMMTTFSLLRANELVWHYYKRNYLQGEKPTPIDLLYWNSDPSNLPAKMITTYLRGMYYDNRLKQSGGITLNNVPIELEKINVPTYFLATENDHIAPWKSVYAGTTLHSGEVTFVLGGAGHVAGVVNHPENNKYYYYVNKKLRESPQEWLTTAKQCKGSWWNHWEDWLRSYSGNSIPKREALKDPMKSIEDAPGSYVRVRLLEKPKSSVSSDNKRLLS